MVCKRVVVSSSVPTPPAGWYLPLASHLRSAYLRYAFTMGTTQEVDFLMDVLGLKVGSRLLDVGMGPGRHSLEFSRRGCDVVGIDIAPEFVEIARRTAEREKVTASFFVMDAASLPFEGEFDAVVSLCEGAFGLGLDDLSILRRMAAALRRGGMLAAAAANVFYVLAHMKQAGEFDPVRMLYREEVEVIGEGGGKEKFSMWNSCFTPRELTWLANGAALEPMAVYGVEPGNYRQESPTSDHPELLLVAKRPLRSEDPR